MDCNSFEAFWSRHSACNFIGISDHGKFDLPPPNQKRKKKYLNWWRVGVKKFKICNSILNVGIKIFCGGKKYIMPDTLSQNGVWSRNLKCRLYLWVVPKIKIYTFYDTTKLQNIKIEVFKLQNHRICCLKNFYFPAFFFKIANSQSHCFWKNNFLIICSKLEQTNWFPDRILLKFR